MKEVLIVEDDSDINELIFLHLKDQQYNVTQVFNGKDGFEWARTKSFDLIILDLMLPEMDGLMVCQKLRALDNFTPILMLTAKSEEFDKVMGLESGADDYMTKPFGIREFLARVKAILRRNERFTSQHPIPSEILKRDELEIHLDKRQVRINEKRIDLTPKEFQLLLLMAGNPGKNFTREELLSQIWGYEFQGYEHTVNSHVNRLRSKIEPNEKEPRYILTSWGVGYRFNEDL